MDEQKDELLLNQEEPTADEPPVAEIASEPEAQTIVSIEPEAMTILFEQENIGREEFFEFQRKVIAAFKHFGYDVRKNFGV